MGRPQAFDEVEVTTKAMEIFWSNGFLGTRTRDLIEGTRLSNGSFFNGFTDKNNMYLKCLQLYEDIYMVKLEQLLLSNNTFGDKMKLLLQYTVRRDTKSGNYRGCFHFNTLNDYAIEDQNILNLAQEISEKVETLIKKAIEIGKANNEIPASVKNSTLAKYIVAIISGLRVLLKTDPSHSTVSNIITTALLHPYLQ